MTPFVVESSKETNGELESNDIIQQNSGSSKLCTKTIYDYTLKDLNGNDVSLSKYSGHLCVIVNYATTCFFTFPNMFMLSKMANEYKQLKIIIIPSNSFKENFGGNDAAIKLAKKHPEFDVFAEISVVGASKHPLYEFLITEQPGLIPKWSGIKWNFTKFVIDPNGCVIERFGSGSWFNFRKYVTDQLNKSYD